MTNEQYIVITGSMNWKKEDRTLTRSEILPLQIIDPQGKINPVPHFQSIGELGIGSIAWEFMNPTIWYLSTGHHLWIIDIETMEKKEIFIPNLAGVHEISIIAGKLWITNTLVDEVISYDIKKEAVEERIQLKNIRNLDDFIIENSNKEKNACEVDTFHCNQVFQDYKGQLHCLVHHTSGVQLIRKIADRFIKRQGNGGILCLEDNSSIDLGLTAPHSIRLLQNCYWVLDSGTNNLCIYNRQWQLKKTVSTQGWGRGADCTPDQRSFYVGISATRKRYLGIIKGGMQESNALLEFNVESVSMVRKWIIPQVEQINNVYVLPKQTADGLFSHKKK